MAREKGRAREQAQKEWLESGGAINVKELAAAHGVTEGTVRKWKYLDRWQEKLPPPAKKQGGQKSNQNAAGHGAPKGNANAETHGAYSKVHLDSLTAEERAYIEGLTTDTETAMLREFQILMSKERDLTRRIKAYEGADPATLYIDRVVEMLVPKGKGGDTAGQKNKTALTTAMRTVIKASPFDRGMKLEIEYNKLHGRILKLIDAMRAQGIDIKRLDLDERKHTLAKQRLSGEYDIDPDTGEIIDGPQSGGESAINAEALF